MRVSAGPRLVSHGRLHFGIQTPSTPSEPSTLAWAVTAWGNGVWAANTWAGMVDDGGGFGFLRMAPEGEPEPMDGPVGVAASGRRPWYVRMAERFTRWVARQWRRVRGVK